MTRDGRRWGERGAGERGGRPGDRLRARAREREAQKPEGPRVFRVAEVARAVRFHVEERFTDFWVEGELSDVRRAASGAVYFALNDEAGGARLRAVLFAGDARGARARLDEGERVRVRGRLTFYDARGQLQLQARTVLPAGAGDLRARLEAVRKRLDADGLFAAERKRPLPRFPRTIVVVTSATSAALRDVVRVAHDRAPVRLVVADARVSGEGAAPSLVRALGLAQRLPDLDAIIVCRGGGSAEELWPFSDEAVARAVAACRVPTVVGVGHESDVSLAELVADARAATPSNAAELLVPERAALVGELDQLYRGLQRAMEGRLDRERLRLERLGRRRTGRRPDVAAAKARLLRLEDAAERAERGRLARERKRVDALARRVRTADPRLALGRDRRRLAELLQRLERAMARALSRARSRLGELDARAMAPGRVLVAPSRRRLGEGVARLQALSPLAVLE
ncbi:MAG: exodeoxyribonuclease VII large subunit, partial [Myxococcota bacterium]